MNDEMSFTATITGGPIEMRDYDHIRLTVAHAVILPDGTTMDLPAGTLLIMSKPGGIEQKGGMASKNKSAADARDGNS